MQHLQEILPTNISLTYDNYTDILPVENNNTNSTYGSFLILPSKTNGFIFQFNLNFIILSSVVLLLVLFLMSIGIWYWCKRVNHLRRGHSVPLYEHDFIEPIKIPVKHLSPNPIKKSSNSPPPVPPRPTAYATILEKLEYRSNL